MDINNKLVLTGLMVIVLLIPFFIYLVDKLVVKIIKYIKNRIK